MEAVNAFITNTPAVTLASTTVTNTVTVSGTVTANQGTANATPWNENLAQVGGSAVSLGAKASASSIPVVLATDEAALPVTGTFFQTTQPVSAVSLPLPTNAAQETSGNLATVVLQTRNDAQIIDLLSMIVAQLKILNYNLASSMPGAYTDQDSEAIDAFPTN